MEKQTESQEENLEIDKKVGDETVEDSSSDENDEFFFESDHLALRGNADYRSVLRTIVILEAQRMEATKHIDRIAEVQREALQEPEEFLNKIKSGEGLNLPNRINIQELPDINFDKYNVVMPTEVIQPQCSTETVRKKHKYHNEVTIRGRVFDESKPETFNQLWSCEEQRRLEELLIEYPPEPVEMRRFAKIAKALGNRTTRQVASRLQKYFQKLHAAGLPVPGRIPRNARTVGPRKNRMQKQMIRPTTFFPSNFVPVNMPDEDENNTHALDPDFYRNGCQQSMGNSNPSSQQGDDDNDMVVVDVPSDSEISSNDATDEQKMIRLIKRIRRDKEKKYPIEISTCDHNGFRCDFCNDDPIIGTRWHCSTCIHDSIDFCGDCLIAQLQTDNYHSLDHRMIGMRVSTEFKSQYYSDETDNENENEEDETTTDIKPKVDFDENNQINVFDEDYLPQKSIPMASTSYNYMDTNFLPQ